MRLIPFLFCALVLVTALVAVRWGAMIGLIGFVFALMLGAVAISRLTPPRNDVGLDRPLAFGADVAGPRSEGVVRPESSVARGAAAARVKVLIPFP